MTLSKREAALRAEALRQILKANDMLDGHMRVRTCAHLTLYAHPRAALRVLRNAKAVLRKAERALQKWAGR